MISMKDIASQCGVSVATVSKALNDAPDIGEATRKRIRTVADRLGYMANASARALKTKRSYNLGILFVDEQNSGLRHTFYSSLLDSFKVKAEKAGYDVTFINRNIGNRESTYLQHCLYRGVDGVIIACIDFRDPQVQELLASDIPVVTIDYEFDGPSIMSDNEQGAYELVKYAYANGHRKIAFIHGGQYPVTDRRLSGFRRACAEFDLEIPEAYIRCGEYQDPVSCGRLTKELLSLPEPPSCILFPDDLAYIGGMNAIFEADLTIPENVSVIGYDGTNYTEYMSPKLTTWVQNTKDLGSKAAERLIKLIESPDMPVGSETVSGHISQGESVKKIV